MGEISEKDKEKLRVTNETAPKLWNIWRSSKIEGMQAAVEKGFYPLGFEQCVSDTVLKYRRDAFGLSSNLSDDDLPQLFSKLAYDLKVHRKQTLLHRFETGSDYRSDGRVIWASNPEGECLNLWTELNDALDKQEKCGIYHTRREPDPVYDPEKEDWHAFLEARRQEGVIRAIRKLIGSEYEFLNPRAKGIISIISGIGEYPASLLSKEYSTIELIDLVLPNIFPRSVLHGTAKWLTDSRNADVPELEKAYLTGMTVSDVRKWQEDPEGQMAVEAWRHGMGEFGKDTQHLDESAQVIAKRLCILHGDALKAIQKWKSETDPWMQQQEDVRAIPDLIMSDEFRMELYQRHCPRQF